MKQFSFFLLCSLLAAGCPVTEPECSTDAMCAAGETCIGGLCRARGDDAGLDAAPGVDAPRPDLCPGGGATTISGVVRIPAELRARMEAYEGRPLAARGPGDATG